MTDLKILAQRDLREMIAPNVPVAYRSLMVAYWTELLAFMQREHLLVVQCDAATYARLTAYSDATLEARLIGVRQDVP